MTAASDARNVMFGAEESTGKRSVWLRGKFVGRAANTPWGPRFEAKPGAAYPKGVNGETYADLDALARGLTQAELAR